MMMTVLHIIVSYFINKLVQGWYCPKLVPGDPRDLNFFTDMMMTVLHIIVSASDEPYLSCLVVMRNSINE